MEVGQWLGIQNKIAKMEQFKYGWKMTDWLGDTYRQPDFPDGIQTGDKPVSQVDNERRTP